MKDVIIALDFENREQTMKFLRQFNENLYVKVGMELFYKEGYDIIKEIKSMNHKIFLDLKLHDIPTTVYKTMKNLARLDIDMINVHALGGRDMMEKALLGLNEGSNKKRPHCVAVTILTSINEETLHNELLITKNISQTVLKLAENANTAGLDGVVCSPLESQFIHSHIRKDFLTVTPGIRLESDNKNDQARVTTPEAAKREGCDMIVVGRTITDSTNPLMTYNLVKKQFME